MNHCMHKYVAVFMIFFSFKLLAGPQPYPKESSLDKTFTLNQLSKIDTAVLEGNNPSYTFYLPIPHKWVVNSLDLNLIIQFSPLLTASSDLTLMVGNVPLDTIKLDKTKEQPLFWKVAIPKTVISPKVTTIRLLGDMKISDDICRDLENQGNWVTVSGNSNVTYHYNPKKLPLKLNQFPFPFIQKDAPDSDKITFYLPNQITLGGFSPYLQIANTLAKTASWRGVDFEIKKLDEWNNGALQNPAILIGTPDEIAFYQLGLSVPLILNKNKWLNSDGALLDDNQGFIWLTNTSRSPQQPLLLISANTPQGIATAMDAITSNSVHYQATSTSLYIAKPVKDKFSSSNTQNTLTFDDLGYQDSVVFGTGQNLLTYQFNLPPQYSNAPIKLGLVYSHSPFLDKDKTSSMTVNLNGLPINGMKLNPSAANKNIFELELPKKQIKLGKNNLTIAFNLRLPESFCSRAYLSQAWGTLYDSSYLQFTKSDLPIKKALKYYPYLFENQVTLALPKEASFYQDKALLQQLIQFAAGLKQTTSLSITDNQSISKAQSADNLIYFATGREQSIIIDRLKANFNEMINNLSITTSKALQSIDKSLFSNAFSKDQGIGFAGLLPPDPGSNNTQLVVFGFTLNELKLAISLLNTPYKLESLNGNLGVSFINGTYTNLSTRDIHEQVQAEVRLEQTGKRTLDYILYGLGGLIVFLVLYFGIRSTRNR